MVYKSKVSKGDKRKVMLLFICIIVLFCAAVILGVFLGRLSGHKWISGFCAGMLLLLAVNLPKFIPSLINARFFQLILGNGIDAMLIGIAGIISVVPCLPKLSGQRTKYLVVGFLCISLIRTSILPATCSYLNRDELTALSPQVDKDGVYLQTTRYTCGPAAMATVLNAFGINDSEGDIALATGCNSYSGTRSLDLVKYVNSKYGAQLEAEYKYVNGMESLKKMDGIFIAEVRASAFTDHFVAIMDINENSLTLADPSFGQIEAKTDSFLKEWRHKVIVVRKKGV
jgi:uncharacterized protein